MYLLFGSANTTVSENVKTKQDGLLRPEFRDGEVLNEAIKDLKEGVNAKKIVEGCKPWFIFTNSQVGEQKKITHHIIGTFFVSVDENGNPYHTDRCKESCLDYNDGIADKKGLILNNSKFLMPKDNEEEGVVIIKPTFLQAVEIGMDTDGELGFFHNEKDKNGKPIEDTFFNVKFQFASGQYQDDYGLKIDATSFEKFQKSKFADDRKLLRNLLIKGVNDDIKDTVDFDGGYITEHDGFTEVSAEDFHYYGKPLSDLEVTNEHFAMGYFEACGYPLETYKDSEGKFTPFQAVQVLTWVNPRPVKATGKSEKRKQKNFYKAKDYKFKNGKVEPKEKSEAKPESEPKSEAKPKSETKSEPKKKDFSQEVMKIGGFKGFYIFCKAWKEKGDNKLTEILRDVFKTWKDKASLDSSIIKMSLNDFMANEISEDIKSQISQAINTNISKICWYTDEEFETLRQEAENIYQKVLESEPKPEPEPKSEPKSEPKPEPEPEPESDEEGYFDSFVYEDEDNLASTPESDSDSETPKEEPKSSISSGHRRDKKGQKEESDQPSKAKKNPFGKSKLPTKKKGKDISQLLS